MHKHNPGGGSRGSPNVPLRAVAGFQGLATPCLASLPSVQRCPPPSRRASLAWNTRSPRAGGNPPPGFLLLPSARWTGRCRRRDHAGLLPQGLNQGRGVQPGCV